VWGTGETSPRPRSISVSSQERSIQSVIDSSPLGSRPSVPGCRPVRLAPADLDLALPPPTPGQPRRLVRVGRGGLRRRRERDVPILLSVGYSACHWCHVMAHESFEDEATAAIMNRRFVNVKVDREERPDVDAVYMEAVQAMTGRGGWPMTVWLTPGRALLRRHLLPERARHGHAHLRPVIEAITDAWENRRHEITEQAGRSPRPSAGVSPSEDLSREDVLEAAYRALEAAYDPVHGGFGGLPSSPNSRSSSSCSGSSTPSRGRPGPGRWSGQTLADGAGRDLRPARRRLRPLLGRLEWLVPHFEKMLYDNAQLARVYLWAWRELGHPERHRSPRRPSNTSSDLRHPRRWVLLGRGRRLGGRGGQVLRVVADELTDILAPTTWRSRCHRSA
jgi:uncharacterized protein